MEEKYRVLIESNSRQGSSSVGAPRPADRGTCLALLPVVTAKTLSVRAYYGKKSGRIQNEFVHDGSVKHPYTFSWQPVARGGSHKAARRADRWTARARAGCRWRGWVAGIDSTSTVLGERRGQRRFPYKANSGPISSHILSGDSRFFFSPFYLLPPPSPFLPLAVAFVLPFIFILLKAKERERGRKKTRSTKVVLPAVVGEREGAPEWGRVQIALQKTGLRAEISHNAADKKVGHITFGGHVTGMQMADGVVTGTGREMAAPPPPLPHLKDEGEGGEAGVGRRR